MSKKIEGLKAQCAKLVAVVESGNALDAGGEAYKKDRVNFQLSAIEAVTGFEFDLDKTNKKGLYKISKVGKVPKADEFAGIIGVVSTLNKAEADAGIVFSCKLENESEDPDLEFSPIKEPDLVAPDKVCINEFRKLIKDACEKVFCTEADFTLLYGETSKLRKKVTRNAIIAGVVITVATVGIVMVSKNSKGKSDEVGAEGGNDTDVIEPDVDVEDPDIDDIDADEVIVDDEIIDDEAGDIGA